MPRRASNLQSTEKGALDSRAEVLLAALIKEHLVTGEAVGSRVLSDRFSHGYGWSPATIRNVMAELEDAGLVEQPHTSAGRVPTDKGYRYYVDNMLGEARLSRTDLKAIDHLFSASDLDAGSSPDRLMETASHVLSALSQNVGIVISPSLADNRLNHIEFMLLPDRRILVVLVSTANIIHNKVIRLADDLTQDDLDHTARYLNTEFSGKSLLAIRAEIVELMKEDSLRQTASECDPVVRAEPRRRGNDGRRLRRRHFKHSYQARLCRYRAYARAVPDLRREVAADQDPQ
jgi:heat-inducible transcriptional repressor